MGARGGGASRVVFSIPRLGTRAYDPNVPYDSDIMTIAYRRGFVRGPVCTMLIGPPIKEQRTWEFSIS